MRYYVSKKTSVYELCGLILKIDMILVLNIVVMNGKLLKHISYSRNTTVLCDPPPPLLYNQVTLVTYSVLHLAPLLHLAPVITLSTCYYICDLNPLNLQKNLSTFLTSATLDLHLTGNGKSSLTEVV